jgi:hypothetical protein
MKKLALIFWVVFTWNYGWSQSTSCAQTLRLATSTYEQGRLHELEGILANCLKNGFNKEEKVAALKLLTQAYIYLEEPKKADETMLRLLETDHYFTINPDVDPAEFVALYKTFRTKEIYRIGARLGVNATQPNVVNSISAVELADGSKYSRGISILFGGIIDVPIQDRFNDKVTASAELLYLQKKFQVNEITDRTTNTEGKVLTNETTGTETQNWISIPTNIQYELFNKKFHPYIGVGASFDYLLNANLSATRLRTDVTSIQETSFDFKPQRKKLNISAILSAGIKAKVGGGFFIAEVRYLYGITNVNSSSTAYANEQALWEQGYADPVFKLTSLSVSGSYVLNIFNPKKKPVNRR